MQFVEHWANWVGKCTIDVFDRLTFQILHVEATHVGKSVVVRFADDGMRMLAAMGTRIKRRGKKKNPEHVTVLCEGGCL